MIAELGVFALVLALVTAVLLAVLPLAGAHWGLAGWVKLARPAAFAMRIVRAVLGQPVLVLLARRLLGAVCGGQFA
jgi:cytochrome c biogenesis factor